MSGSNSTHSLDPASKTTRPRIRVNDETIAKTQATRQKARSTTLRQAETINVNEKLTEAQNKRKAHLADLDKEL